jgi:hypothetical protein
MKPLIHEAINFPSWFLGSAWEATSEALPHFPVEAEPPHEHSQPPTGNEKKRVWFLGSAWEPISEALPHFPVEAEPPTGHSQPKAGNKGNSRRVGTRRARTMCELIL